jgi:hypothetical protein
MGGGELSAAAKLTSAHGYWVPLLRRMELPAIKKVLQNIQKARFSI